MRSDRSAPVDSDGIRIVGCEVCWPSGWDGYVVAWVDQGRGDGVLRPEWHRCPKRCSQLSRAAEIRRVLAAAGAGNVGGGEVTETMGDEDQVLNDVVPAERKAAGRKPAAVSRPGGRRAVRELSPVVLVDAVDGVFTSDDSAVVMPAGLATIGDLFGWLAAGQPIGVAKVRKDGMAWDGTVCLSAAAAKLAKLPAKLPDWEAAAGVRLAAKLSKAAGAHGLQVGRIGPQTRVYRTRGDEGARVSLALLVVPWLGQGAARQRGAVELVTALATGRTADGAPDAVVLVRRLRAFVADMGVMPGSTAATTGMQLLDAVRPREEWAAVDGVWSATLRPGALPSGDCSVPPAAGGRHELTRAERAAGRPVCEEDDYHQWARLPTAEEAALPWAVAVDVATSFLSVTETLRVPVGAMSLVESPTWDAKVAGVWLADFSALPVDALLPHPATFHGMPPTGPGWYATPTVAYMVTAYGYDPSGISRAYLSDNSAQLLGEWTVRIRQGYKRMMGLLGVVDGMDDTSFLAAYAARGQVAGDPVREDAVVLADAYKMLFKKAIGKWTENAVAQFPDREEWAQSVPKRWTYRPEIRFHIVAAARVAGHRRMRKTLQLTGRAPFAVNVDSYLYASPAPSPLPLLPRTAAGLPVAGALRLGSAPGSFKHEVSIPMPEVCAVMADRQHPHPLGKKYTTAGTPVTTTTEDGHHV